MMTEKKPIRVRRYRSEGHRLETRVFAREIHETFCVDKKCRFFGKPAAQGICHTKLNRVEMSYLEAVSEEADRVVEEMRKERVRLKLNDRQYAARLERQLACDWMNSRFGLDELIRLRAKNSDLRLRMSRR